MWTTKKINKQQDTKKQEKNKWKRKQSSRYMTLGKHRLCRVSFIESLTNLHAKPIPILVLLFFMRSFFSRMIPANPTAKLHPSFSPPPSPLSSCPSHPPHDRRHVLTSCTTRCPVHAPTHHHLCLTAILTKQVPDENGKCFPSGR